MSKLRNLHTFLELQIDYVKIGLIFSGLKIRGLYDTEENTVLESKAQDVIDRNLDQMLTSIHRLKGKIFFTIIKAVSVYW